jgi:hypothetical protein
MRTHRSLNWMMRTVVTATSGIAHGRELQEILKDKARRSCLRGHSNIADLNRREA